MRSALAGQFATAYLGLLLLNPATEQAPTQNYVISGAQSQITVLVNQEGMISKLRPHHRIAVKTFSGAIQLSANDQSRTAVELEAEAKSLTNVDPGISDLERQEFHKTLHDLALEVARFPKISFRSVSVSDLQPAGEGRSFTLHGDLNLHGVTRRLAVPMTVILTPGQLRATGEVKLKQTDFDIKPYAGGFGLIKVGDEVKVSFTIVAKAS